MLNINDNANSIRHFWYHVKHNGYEIDDLYSFKLLAFWCHVKHDCSKTQEQIEERADLFWYHAKHDSYEISCLNSTCYLLKLLFFTRC